MPTLDPNSPEALFAKRTADLNTPEGLQNAGFSGNAAPSVIGTMTSTPGNVRQDMPNGDVVNYKPFVPAGGGAFDPSSVIGPAPTVTPSPANDPTSIAGRWGDTSSPEYQNQMRQHQDSLQQVAQYLDLSHSLAAQHEDAHSKADAADFLSNAHNQLDPTSPNYEKNFADLMAAHPRAASNQGVRELVSTLHSARAVHLKHAELGGAAEFGGVAQDVYKDQFAQHKNSEEARAAATDVHNAFATGAVTHDDLYYNSKTDHSSLYTDDGHLDVAGVRRMVESKRAEQARAGSDAKVALAESRSNAADARAAAADAKAAQGPVIKPQQGDDKLIKAYPLGSKKLAALDQQIAKQTDPNLKQQLTDLKNTAWDAHKRARGLPPTAALGVPGEPAVTSPAAPAGTPTGTPAPVAQLTPQDQKAIAWAQDPKNASSPWAAPIKKIHNLK